MFLGSPTSLAVHTQIPCSHTDPLGEVRKLYDYFGMTLTPDAEDAMRHYLENDPKKTKYGNYTYTLEEFNITEEDLKETFKEYIALMTEIYPIEDIF